MCGFGCGSLWRGQWVGGREGQCLPVWPMDISLDRFFLGGGPAHHRRHRRGA